MERADELKERIRQQPLNDRLEESRRRIGDMCSKGRCPKMTIPVQHDDDDFYINTTLADAQATIAALQARVEALEGWQDGVVTAFREAPLEWSPDLGQGNIPSALPQIFKNMHDYATKLTQRTAECDALKLVNDTHMKTVMKLSHVVEQRTAELEAAQHDAEVYRKMHAVASMERNILSNERADLQAELERVSLLSSHNERRFEMLEEKYKELRTLILTLPKVEGEIRLIHADDGDWHVVDLYDAIFTDKSWAVSYAAMLQHRQGMEG